jgi:hypothetical protein
VGVISRKAAKDRKVLIKLCDPLLLCAFAGTIPGMIFVN